MLSWYLAAFNHPKPKHPLSHVLPRFRRGKPRPFASSWRVAKWHAGGHMADVIWHVLRNGWHSASVVGFGEIWRELHRDNLDSQHSCVPQPIALEWAHCHVLFSVNLICAKVRRAWDLSDSHPPEFLVGVIIFCVLASFCSWSCIFLFSKLSKKRSWLNMAAGRCFVRTTHAMVENQTLRVSGRRLNKYNTSASIFADLYPMSACLTIHGDNDDTPCMSSSPFQRFTVSLSEAASEPLGGGRGRCNFRALGRDRGRCNFRELYLRTMPSSPFCESRGPRILIYKFGTLQSLRYDGFSALPVTVHQVGRASLAVSRMHLLVRPWILQYL